MDRILGGHWPLCWRWKTKWPHKTDTVKR